MAPTNRGVDKQSQNRRQTAATPVFNHDGTNIVITPNSNRSSSFPSLNIPFTNVPPGVTRHEDIPFTQFTQQQQSFNGMNLGMNQMNMHQQQQLQQQHFSGDHLSSSSSAPTPTPTPGPGNGFQGSAFFSNNNNMHMRPMGSSPNFYNNGHPGSLGSMYGNGMQQMQSPGAYYSLFSFFPSFFLPTFSFLSTPNEHWSCSKSTNRNGVSAQSITGTVL